MKLLARFEVSPAGPQAHLNPGIMMGRLFLNCFWLGPFSALVLFIGMALMEGTDALTTLSMILSPFMFLGSVISGLACSLASLPVYLPLTYHVQRSPQPFHRQQTFRQYLPVVMGIMVPFGALVVFHAEALNFAVPFAFSAFVTAVIGLSLFIRSVEAELRKKPSHESVEK